jgi:hypothetical protein
MSKVYFDGIIESMNIRIVRVKSSYKSLNRLEVIFNQLSSEDITYDGITSKGYSIGGLAHHYVTNGYSRALTNNSKFMDNFTKTLNIAIEEFKKDVDYDYSLDGWIGRIFIEPFENFVDWLKK